MSASIWLWPALDLRRQPVPSHLEVGRAVWGKVDGAASDYRWIASSPGLDPRSRRLELELLLGTEDAPEKTSCWRALAGSYCAVSCYRSRAMDAARRSGFLEKQVLEWRPAGSPAVLGALLLLPRVSRLGDEVWWTRSDDPGWEDPGFLLTLDSGNAPSVEVSDDVVKMQIENGCAALREAVEEADLAAFYSAVLTDGRPAVLPKLSQPLNPEAVAALLLPLGRNLADRLSIAGWVVSQRIDPESFLRLWDVLLCQRIPSALREIAIQSRSTVEGQEAARAVFEGEPPRSTRSTAVPAASARLSEGVEKLVDFATDDQRRWLGPDGLGRTLRLLEEEQGEDLVAGVRQAREEAAGADDPWRRLQLAVKADLLQAALLALAPARAKLDLPTSGRVPALLFAPCLNERDWDRFGDSLGPGPLAAAVRQSLACSPDLFGGALRSWLETWKRGSRLSWLRGSLEEAGKTGAASADDDGPWPFEDDF